VLRIETKAGIIESQVDAGNVRIKLTPPRDIKLDIPLKVDGRGLKLNFINTGVPHVVIFVEGLDKIDVSGIGRTLRYHKKFAPRGTNVNFVETLSQDSFKIRTYERGVEDETLACGTGTVASALIFARKSGATHKIEAYTRGGEKLTVYFERSKNSFNNVWLEGRARIVYEGEYYV
jgi:diaminopimelate epimerase